MKCVFLSNHFNHHQRFLSQELRSLLDGGYTFVSTKKPSQKRIGYITDNPEYVVCAYEGHSNSLVIGLINDSDVVIAGSTPEAFVAKALRLGKPVFRYSERPLKNGKEPLKFFPRLLTWHCRNPYFSPMYLLAASAYASGDYSRLGLFKRKAYKWGYFPEALHYEEDSLFNSKNRQMILWVARFLDLKHPEVVLDVASRLKKEGYCFTLKMIGDGPLRSCMERIRDELDLEAHVQFVGLLAPEAVRSFMEQSGIFLFTSDRREGWGAVLNEAMNSGCAVVSSHSVGSAPYLIKQGENGYVYQFGDTDELYRRVKYLLDNPEEQRRIGKAAYKTIVEEWNAEVAAERFVNLAQHILDGDKHPDLYESGPCSRAEIIREDWYKGES